MKPPKGYRLVRRGGKVHRGDRIMHARSTQGNWVPAPRLSIGDSVTIMRRRNFYVARRK